MYCVDYSEIQVMLIHIRTLSDCHENDSLDIHLAILSH